MIDHEPYKSCAHPGPRDNTVLEWLIAGLLFAAFLAGAVWFMYMRTAP